MSKINKRKLKALALITLSGCMALTLTYSHPKPYNNWGVQELYWKAEFSTVDYLYYYSEIPEHTIYNSSWSIVVDTDFRLAGILEGYLGIGTLIEYPISKSWLKTVLLTNVNDLETIVTNTSPTIINSKIDFILISRIMIEDGFHIGWAAYADDNNEWIIKFPRIGDYICFNPYINRIYDSKISYLLFPLN